jgi:uncharacterized membrane protein
VGVPLRFSDTAIAAALGGAALLVVLALVSIWRSRVHSRRAKAVWIVLAVLVPVLGPAAWFLLGRERRRIR